MTMSVGALDRGWRSASLPRLAIGAIAGLALAATTADGQQTFQSQNHPFRVVTVAEGLQNPWGLAFLPNGDVLVTERAGRLRIIRNGTLLPNPVEGVPAVRALGQGGLLDVAIHPEFATNRLVYLSFSKPNDDRSEGTTAVIRARLENDRLVDVQEIFEAKAWSRTNGHYGSRIVFDGNGYVFISIGDRQAPPVPEASHPAQDLSNHQGTIIRLHDDGRVPSDNPFVGRAGALPEIWAYGIRSPQGLVRHPQTGELWELEHGPRGGDEVNLIQPGRNYGWPVITYGINYNGQIITEATAKDGMEQPLHQWTPSIATSGLAFYTGDAFPQWKGSLFAGGLVGQYLSRLTFDGHRFVGEEKLLEGYGRIRDVRNGPDGFIYVLTDAAQGRVVRLEPAR
jgi:aldose sugar dehydrogenase